MTSSSAGFVPRAFAAPALPELPAFDVPGKSARRPEGIGRAHVLHPGGVGVNVGGERQRNGWQLITEELGHLDSLLDPLVLVQRYGECLHQFVVVTVRPPADI